jgi:predicted ATPase
VYPERLTLQRAAVIGLIFYDTALLALDAADETHISDLPGVLRHLTQRGFIQPRESSTFEGSVEYTFNGIMLREALLATLVSRQTSAYHTAAASWLIEVGGKRAVEYSVLIAGHFEAAGSLERAADYLIQAGDRAFSLCAFAEAAPILSTP